VQIPLRLQLLVRTEVPTGVLLAAAYAAVVFMATPLLLPAIADEYDLSLGATSFVATAQLGGFVLGSWGAGRFLDPRRRVFTTSLVIVLVANAVSVFLPTYSVLISLRVVSGLALGIIVWFSWVLAFGDSQRTSEVAVVGPLIGVVSAPIIGLVVGEFGPGGSFALFAALAVIPLVFGRTTHMQVQPPQRTGRNRPTRSALVMLLALLALTLGGSAVFSFSAIIAGDLQMSPLVLSLAYSANALAGVPSARAKRQSSRPWLWLIVVGTMATLLTVNSSALGFYAIVMLWGFAYWRAVPPAFTLLAERSNFPEQRAGDAQAIMAVGRVIGPLIAGLLLDQGDPWVLGVVASTVIGSAAVAVWVVQHRPA
jgi:predicted MFS family arabinose efflux permease